MCGIAGKMWFDATAPADRQVIERMTSVLAHRGPDAEGFHLEPGIGLGHRRLSIIDLPGGEQPMPNETGSIWVVFNGEIYNYQELRRDLLARGHRFRSTGDTEVIVHAYEEWGEDAVTRFRGMFAYALWDAPRRRLVLVRDRMGVKPLFFARTPGGVTFGSEIKALLQDPAVPRSWSPEALDAFLTLQYIPSPLAIYTHVEKLPAGHLAVVERGHVTVRQYWDLTFGDDGAPRSEASWLEQLEALVDDAVRSRLVSDVPLGAFLSGGIDSSLVVSSMAAQAGGRVVTTSVGFEEQAFNELEAARLVAGHLGTASHEHIVQPDIAALLPRLAWHFDEPFSDSSAVPTFHVSAAARRHVTVALSGDGGDELWAGYTRHRIEHREAGARHWLGAGSKPMGRLAALLPLAMKGARSLRHLALSPADACAR
ncbi:MAG: asparagine synthase (glutamine-hydrolyzing), partial [Vicinamibacterales bacterium]